jgi:hypothetical protein
MLRTLDQVRRSPGPEAVRAALDELPEALRREERSGSLPEWLRGLWLAGSYAVGRETPLSDVDLRADVRIDETAGVGGRVDAALDRLDAAHDIVVAAASILEPLLQVGLWDQFPLGRPQPPQQWAPAFACGRELWTRPGVREAWVARAGGPLPDPAEALAEVRRQRAERVMGYTHDLLAFAAVSFGHGTLAALRLPVPDDPDQVPLALARAGVVRPRDAEWVYVGNQKVIGDLMDPRWHGWNYSERGWDFVAAAYRAEVLDSVRAAARDRKEMATRRG